MTTCYTCYKKVKKIKEITMKSGIKYLVCDKCYKQTKRGLKEIERCTS